MAQPCASRSSPLLGIIEGGFNFDFRRRHYEAAAALGIKLVIIDREGHWTQRTHTHLREMFLSVDMTLDDELPSRIIKALEQHQVELDGLTSFTDSYLVYTARICEILQLTTSPSHAYARAVNKYETRRWLGSSLDPVHRLHAQSVPDLLPHLMPQLRFPLIIKPISGGGSQGVTKVPSEPALLGAISQLSLLGGSGELLFEEFIDGPEVDVNFILHNREILFSEVVDNLPSSAELRTNNTRGNFLETCAVWPSALEGNEQDLLRQSLYGSLMKLGFTTGVFHVEARVRDSSKSYERTDVGTLDLVSKKRRAQDPTAFLIEVNGRSPGRECARGADITYGVDYYAIQLLLAVGDVTRAKLLSTPRRQPGGKDQRFWCAAVYIPADIPGILATENICDDVLKRRQDIAPYVAEAYPLIPKGANIPPQETGILRWIATFMVTSTKSREELLHTVQIIQREATYSVL